MCLFCLEYSFIPPVDLMRTALPFIMHPLFWTFDLDLSCCDEFHCDQIWTFWFIRRLRSIQSEPIVLLFFTTVLLFSPLILLSAPLLLKIFPLKNLQKYCDLFNCYLLFFIVFILHLHFITLHHLLYILFSCHLFLLSLF